MAKNTQTICQQQPKNCLSVFDRIVGLALKGFNLYRYSEDAYSLQMRLIVIVVLLWIMVVFVMGSVQVCVGRVALALNLIMTVTLEDVSTGWLIEP